VVSESQGSLKSGRTSATPKSRSSGSARGSNLPTVTISVTLYDSTN